MEVAIKKVADVFADAVDAKRILREVRLMRHWNHPCVLGLYDIVEPSYSTHFDDLYIVTPLLTTDLSRIIYSRTVLSDPQVLYLLYQTCCGVHYINSAGVLHRDLKPANLIVDVKSCALKVCDFGLSRPYVQGHRPRASADGRDGQRHETGRRAHGRACKARDRSLQGSVELRRPGEANVLHGPAVWSY